MTPLSSVRDSLSFLGLTPQATSCYEVLVAIPSETVAGIAKRAKLHRPTVYRELERLEKQGLVERSTLGKRTHYRLTSLDRLELLVKERTSFLSDAFQSFSRVAVATPSAGTQVQGDTGLRSIQEDIVRELPRGGTFLRISMRKPSLDMTSWTDASYARLRESGKLQVIDIVNPAQREHPCKVQLECVFRLLPRECDHVPFQGAMFLYGNRLAFADYEGKNGYIIEDSILVAFLEKLFRVLFNLLPLS